MKALIMNLLFVTAANRKGKTEIPDTTRKTRDRTRRVVETLPRLGFGFVLAVAFVGLAAAQCVTAPSGLVSWWPGNGSGMDIVGGNNGTLTNGATFATGEVGLAFSFNGANQYVQVADAPSLDITGQITIDAWVFPTAVPGSTNIIVNKEVVPGSGVQYELGIRGTQYPGSGTIPVGNFVFYLGGLSISGFPNDFAGWLDGGGAVPLNTWTHVALTYDGSNAKAYINGNLTRTVATTVSFAVTPPLGPLRIGSRSDYIIITSGNSNDPFQGSIDEVEIFNRALAASEILGIVTAGSAGKCESPFIISLLQTLQNLIQQNRIGPGTSLYDKLTQVANDITTNNGLACSDLGAFADEVNAQTGKTISASQSTYILQNIGIIRSGLNCGPNGGR